MKLKEALRCGTRLLCTAGIENASFESELLLRSTLGWGRAELFTELASNMTAGAEELFFALVRRRACHEPSAYIVGKREFYGLDFCLDSRAFIPRPESELLVERALAFLHRQAFRQRIVPVVADIGTGSGALAISIAYHFAQTEVYAIDISSAALEVALANSERHRVTPRVHCLRGDMVGPLPGSVDLIVANLPYIPRSQLEGLDEEIKRFEPRLALDGGAEGLDLIGRLLEQIASLKPQPWCMLLEVGQGQGMKVAEVAKQYLPGVAVELHPDLSGIERVVEISTVAW